MAMHPVSPFEPEQSYEVTGSIECLCLQLDVRPEFGVVVEEANSEVVVVCKCREIQARNVSSVAIPLQRSARPVREPRVPVEVTPQEKGRIRVDPGRRCFVPDDPTIQIYLCLLYTSDAADE